MGSKRVLLQDDVIRVVFEPGVAGNAKMYQKR